MNHPAAQFETLRTIFGTDTPFFDIIESASVAMWVLQPTLEAVYLNRTWLRYTGIDATAAFGTGWSAALHPDDREACLDAFRCCVRDRRAVAHECRGQRADGTVGWVRHYAVPQSGTGDGEVRALIVTAIDITRLRQALERQAETAERLHLAITGSSDGIWDWPDVTQPAMWWSSRCYEISGYEPGDIQSDINTFFSLVHPDDVSRVAELLQRSIADKRPYDAEFRLRRRDGDYRWCRTRGDTSLAGLAIRMSGSLQDIQRAKESVAEIAILQERHHRAEAGSTNGLWEWDLASDRLWLSENFRLMMGLPDLETLAPTQRRFEALIHPEDRPQVALAVTAHLRDQVPLVHDFRMRSGDCEYRWLRSRGVSQRLENGQVTLLSGSLSDIHEIKTAQLALQVEKEKIQMTLSSLGEPVITTDPSGRIEFLNAAAEALFGISLPQVANQAFASVFEFRAHSARVALFFPVDQCLFDDSGVATGESRLRVAATFEGAIEYTARKIRSAADHTYGVVVILRDVTEKRRIAEQISHQAMHDSLTGLVNRYEFERRLTRVISYPPSPPDAHALFFLDLDRFKFVNDTCGHAAGDALLRQVAKLMKAEVRRRDTVARLGGDEFAVLMEYCDLRQAERVAHAIRERLATYQFPWETRHFSIGVSIGLFMLDARTDTLAVALSGADSACYSAKKFGRNRVHVFGADEELVGVEA